MNALFDAFATLFGIDRITARSEPADPGFALGDQPLISPEMLAVSSAPSK